MDIVKIIIGCISVFGLSLMVGLLGRYRSIGFFMAFWVSFFFTPVIGIIVTLLYKKKEPNK
jgi:hypothetical protein